MKLVLLIVVSCMFAGLDAATNESSSDAIETLKQRATVLFDELVTKVAEVTSGSLEYIYAKHEALNEKLLRIACHWTSEVSVSKSNVLNQFAQNKEEAKHSGSSAAAIKLCSISATINVDLYINPMIQTNIQSDLIHHQNTMQSLQANIYTIITGNDVFEQYSKVVKGDNVSVETLEAFIAALETLLPSYKDEVKSGFSTYINTLQFIVYQFEMRSLEKIQLAQQYLANVNMYFQNCLADNYGL